MAHLQRVIGGMILENKSNSAHESMIDSKLFRSGLPIYGLGKLTMLCAA